jgi:ABC-type Fe3+ transport system substrate-binding protein
MGTIMKQRLQRKIELILLLGLCWFSLGSSTQSFAAASNTDWDKTVEAARREGKVSVWGPPGGWARSILADEFHKRFPEIKVEYNGASGSKAWTKIKAERDAGLYTVDVHVGGVGTAGTAIYQAKALQPIEAAFLHPEVQTKSSWWRGNYHFGDPENKFVLVFSISPIPAIAYNPQLVDRQSFKSYKDLLQPKWKGKIVMVDPRVSGPGATRWHALVELMGREYVTSLAGQLVLTRDLRQSVEWIATGKYPFGTGLSDVHVEEFSKKGAQVSLLSHLAEGNVLAAGWGTVNLFQPLPNPNAAKLYINWLLSKEGQIAWQKSGYNSARVDIPKDNVNSWNRIVEGVKYVEEFSAQGLKKRTEVSIPLAREILKD